MLWPSSAVLAPPLEERKTTSAAFTSKEAPGVPSCLFQMRGLPFASGVRRPSTYTFAPLRRYWLTSSACLPQEVTRNHTVSSCFSPAAFLKVRVVATEYEVTGVPAWV